MSDQWLIFVQLTFVKVRQAAGKHHLIQKFCSLVSFGAQTFDFILFYFFILNYNFFYLKFYSLKTTQFPPQPCDRIRTPDIDFA